MTDYNAITDNEIEPEKPVTTSLMTRLRDNPIAITEGAAGAPQIQTAAIANSAVTTAKIANTAVTAAKLATGNNERDWVLARIAAASAGAVGTYGLFNDGSAVSSRDPGETTAGSNLRWTNVNGAVGAVAQSPSGTWRLVGLSFAGDAGDRTSLWFRIS